MRRKIIAGVAVACLLLPYAGEAWSHGGGLDRYGCHNETATGGYHCHRDDDDKIDDGTAWAIVGGLALGLLVLYWLKQNNKHPETMLVPASETESRSPLIPMPYAERDQNGRVQIGAVWKFDF